ncbi:MAG: FixH family protein [Deltaproteobacteria bacterium]|nr:FixH family protein [Deltaproteobacteria bacterium]
MILAIALACGSPSATNDPVEPPAWGAARTTQNGKYEVTLVTEPDPPVRGELFEVSARFTELDGTPIEDGKVSLDARMPQHNHGMMTDPVDDPGHCDAAGAKCTHPGGVYEASGFKFHMGGEWTITVDVVGPRGPDSTSFVYSQP